MQVKLVKDGGSETFECRHVEVKDLKELIQVDGETVVNPDPNAPLIGYQVEITPIRSSDPSITLRLPDDGKAIYFMNDQGDTSDSLPWPPRPKQDNKGGS